MRWRHCRAWQPCGPCQGDATRASGRALTGGAGFLSPALMSLAYTEPIVNGEPMSSTHRQVDLNARGSFRALGNNFNLLRFLFASLVILSHCVEIKDGNRSHEWLTRLFGTMSFGELALDGFFVLSGYLIVRSWVNNQRWADYLRNRVLRIYPGFIAASLLCAVVFGPIGAEPDYFRDFYVMGFIKAMLWLDWPEIPPVFQETHYPLVNGAMWTIGLEFQCYLFVLAFGVLIGFKRRAYWLGATLVCAAVFLAGRYIGHGILHEKIFKLGMQFGAGACYFLYGQRYLNRRSWMAVSAAALFALMFNRELADLAFAVFGAYLVLSFACRHDRYIGQFNRLPDISYGVYLYAWPLTKVILLWYPDTGRVSLIMQTWLLSVVAGLLSWYLVERPFMAMKRARSPA
jgi:peptidoglycan/LPS O-acetylase OafA/YrhL